MWRFVLCDRLGAALTVLAGRDRRLRFQRNRAAEAEFALDLEDPAASLLMGEYQAGLPRLKAYRDGALRFYGHLGPLVLEGDDGAGLARFTFRDPFDLYETSHLEAPREFSQVDAGEIARTLLVERTNADTLAGYPPQGLNVGTIEPTVLRDRSYEQRKAIGEAVRQLAEVDGGFDFFVDPREDLGAPVLGTFEVRASQGEDRPLAQFAYGVSLTNVLRVVQEVRRPVTAVEVFSQETGDFARAIGGADVYGRLSAVQAASDGTTVAATLQAGADALLRPSPIEVVSFDPEPNLAPAPWDDYFIGDTVRLVAKRGALDVSLQPRVAGLEIGLDDDGNESEHRLTFDAREALT